MLRTGSLTVVAVVLTLCGVMNVAEAQQERKEKEKVKANKGEVSVDVDVKGNRDKEVTRRDKASRRHAHRASEIQEMAVKNKADKDLGTVSDIVIDVRGGEVKYAALSYGGFLGVGDKLFAVPWYALEHRHDAAGDEHVLLLSIDEATLKNAPGFDQSEWPNFAEGEVADEIEKHYGKFRRQREGQAGVAVKAGAVKVDVDFERKADRRERREATSTKDIVRRASEITGMTVKNEAGKELGSVNDLVIDMDSGKVRYAALSYGGFVGIGDKLFAVPWDGFDSRYNASDEEYYLVVKIDETTLRKAPGFDQNKWPNVADPKFADAIDEYYDDTRRSADRSKTSSDEGDR